MTNLIAARSHMAMSLAFHIVFAAIGTANTCESIRRPRGERRVVALSGVASAFAVVIANAWMNTPTGFELVGGRPVNIDPIARSSLAFDPYDGRNGKCGADGGVGAGDATVEGWVLLT